MKLSTRTAPTGDPNAVTYDIKRYNPYLVESLLDRNLRQLESCLALRTQYLDFQAEAESLDMNFDLFQKLQDLEERQESILREKEGYKALSGQTELSHIEESGTVAPTPESLQHSQELSVALRKIAAERREMIKQHEFELSVRRGNPDDGTNYHKRKDRVVLRFAALLAECSFISLAVSDGMFLVYEVRMLPPQPAEKDYLDKLVMWNKSVLVRLERILRRDSEYTVLIDLKRGKKADGSYIVRNWTTGAENDTREAKTTLSRDSIEFSIEKDQWFKGQSKIRLRGFKVYIYPAPRAPSDYGEWNVTVDPPNYRVGEGADEVSLELPQVRFGAVGESLAGNTRFNGGAYFNTDPCQGTWSLKLPERSSRSTFISAIEEIDLLLKVATLSED